jgi:hypothetical protein
MINSDKFLCKVPVVLIIYRRPQMTARIIDSLRNVKPSEIFVIADGPKNIKDAVKCQKTRALIKSIDWKCKIYRKYSSKNLGLRKRVVSGLNWVFSKVDRAIILEDDLEIDRSFYRFCSDMLDKYKDNEKVISISGNNFIFGRHKINNSYYFSKFIYSWGWATWKRAWKLYDDDMLDWPKLKKLGTLKKITGGFGKYLYWTRIFDLTYKEIINSWAYRWIYTSFVNKKLSIVPCENLVANVGIGKDATHTAVKSRVLGIPIKNIKFPLKHPKIIKADIVADAIVEKTLYITPRIVAGLLIKPFLYHLKN